MDVAIYLKVIPEDKETNEPEDFGIKLTLGQTNEEVDYEKLVGSFDIEKLKTLDLIPISGDYNLEFITKEEYEQNYGEHEEFDYE